MMQPVLAAADIIEILARGIPVILFVLWLVGQALAERQKQGKMARQPRPAPPKQKGKATPEIEEEIDAFLRRAAEKKGRPQKEEETVILVPSKEEARRGEGVMRPQPAAAKRHAPTPRQTPEKVARSRQGDAAAKADSLVQRRGLAQPEQKSRRLAAPLSGGIVWDRAHTPLTSSISTAHRSDLAADTSLTDEKLETHLHSVFDHQVGRLRHDEVAPQREAIGSPLARSVVEMLKNPEGVRQAIVVNEILKRPEI